MRAVGLSQPCIAAMLAKGWNTLAAYAYACGYVPGSGNSDDLFTAGVLVKIVGDQHDASADSPRLRRLFFESHTLAIQDLRRRSERTETDPIIKLPMEERIVRLRTLRAKYLGHDISGVLEPSHALVDLVANMLETGQLRYVPWSSCTTRDAEVTGIKKLDKDLSAIVTDSTTGFLRRSEKQEEYIADVSSDLMLVQALQRRAFAFELAGVCDFSVLNSLTNRLLKELTRPALFQYQRVTMEQIENADRHVFIRLAALTTGGVGQKADGTWPVKEAMDGVLVEPELAFLLMQMPTRAGAGNATSSSNATKVTKKSERGDSRSRSRRRKITEQNSRNRAANEATKGTKGNSKSKGAGKAKGKGKGKASRFNPAVETSRTHDGRPICFAYQDGSCSSVAPGQTCSRGYHGCWKIGCTQTHAGKDH